MAKTDEPTLRDAIEAFEAGDLEAAMVICEGLLGEDEAKAPPEVLHLLGECSLELQEAEEALHLFDLALRSAPDEPAVLLGRGTALFELGRFDDAEAAFTRSSEGDADLGEPLFYLGLIAEFRGDLEGATALYAAAVERDPEQLVLPTDWSALQIQEAFDAMVEECPDPVAEWLAALNVTVRDLPTAEDLETEDGPTSPLRHCRFVGEPGDGPFGEDPEEWLDAAPSEVVLYRRNLGKTAHDDYELRREVFEAVLWETMDFLCLEDEHLMRLGVLEPDDDD